MVLTRKICRLLLQALVRKIGAHPTPDQKRDIALRHSQIQDKVDAFQKQAGSVLHTVSSDADDSWGDDNSEKVYTGAEFDSVDEEDEVRDSAPQERYQTQSLGNSHPDSHLNAEDILLHLPSYIGRSWCNANAAEDLAKAELRLREGQLNDSLHHIRIALGHKSYLFRNNVRPAHTQRLKTRAWAEVHAAESTVQHHARVYNRARQSIVNLGADDTLLDRYKVLEPQDLKINTAVIVPDVRGQRNKSLPWFWSIDIQRDANVGAWMNDCKCISIHARSGRCSKNIFKLSLSSALAESESSKDTVGQRASMSPSRDGVCCQIFPAPKPILEREARAHRAASAARALCMGGKTECHVGFNGCAGKFQV